LVVLRGGTVASVAPWRFSVPVSLFFDDTMGTPPSTKIARRLQLICKVLFIVQGLAVARTLLGFVMSLFSGYLSSMLWLSLVNLLFPALLLLGTAMVLERSNQRYAWVAVVILIGLTPLLFTGYSLFGLLR
jgi:hypothetical protein